MALRLALGETHDPSRANQSSPWKFSWNYWGKGMRCKVGVAEGYFVTWKVAVGHLRTKSQLREAELKSGEGQNLDKNT